ncbi:NADH:ubiquinone oxidoreductase subunit N, partial [Neisseria meningitidis]
MNWSDLNLMPAMPEIVLLALLVLLLLAVLWVSDDKRRRTHYGALATGAVTAGGQLACVGTGQHPSLINIF